MTSATSSAPQTAVPEIVVDSAKPPQSGWLAWLTTTDHKRIGIMYMVAAWMFLVIGGVEALLIRLQLAVPDNTLLSPQTYNALFTMHGTTMVFLFLMPMIVGLANYIVPLMIGARDMAFPKLNALSFWLFIAGGIVFYGSLLFSPAECGWTCYAPLSETAFSPSNGVDSWIFLVHLTGVTSFIGALNLFVTITNMRAPGMSWGRVPLYVWTMLVQSILLIISIPVIAGAVTLLLTDRHFGTHFYDPTNGGSPLLWQHLFWFFGHPEVYILVLPGFGIISEILPVFSRKPIFGYKAIVAATLAIAVIGTLVWAHHMFTVPLPFFLLVFFMLGTYLVAIPTGVKIFNWIFTMWRGAIEFPVSMLYSLGFLATFLLGGITGIFLATFPVDWQLHDTYFVVAHFHYTIVGGAVFALMAGIYYWFPKITGRLLDEKLGKVSFALTLSGFWITFLIQHSAGLSGMPRRVYEYADVNNLGLYNMISTIGSFILALGVLLTIVNIVKGLRSGAKAGPDPWRGNTLEWFTPSPPPVNNFDVVPRIRSVEPMQDIRRQIARQDRVPEEAGTAAGS
ncbi:MAG: cytochrome c oxidase subunit I [Actinobacteria bacterium]|uniref:cytochrome-c oxidase n=1 Tax=freshwater metagenome TaxID=449393 RepID=A0A6J5ZFK7_9ZZZZ|nr:cytochrome c oxidase subunit I [Actinomycetota bacterium]